MQTDFRILPHSSGFFRFLPLFSGFFRFLPFLVCPKSEMIEKDRERSIQIGRIWFWSCLIGTLCHGVFTHLHQASRPTPADR
jgi:hypothetical protein